ncbi:MAG TPA: 2-phosphosulfolactate phosphatase [Cyclobacteriaceae bacterium]
MPERKIETCLSPGLIHLHNLEGKIVVIVDILRATSCMVTALAYGVKSIIPVSSLEHSRELKEEGCLASAEREGKKVEGFDLGNSPFEYMQPHLKGRTIAATTTNGTQAINKSKNSDTIIIGAFLNLDALAKFIISTQKGIVIHCSGWKNNVNLEDTLFAGALIERLSNNYRITDDTSLMSMSLWLYHKDNLLEGIKQTSHFKRLNRLGIEKDIEYCLIQDKYDIVPFMKGDELVIS